MSRKYLTPKGFKELQEELEYLKSVRRKELAEKLERAISFGDISENAEFQEAKEEQAFIEGRILELEEILRTAKVFEGIDQENTVQIGSTILVSNGSAQESFTIVGAEEADPRQGRISIESPFGRAVLNQRKGAFIVVDTPEGQKKYKILKIE
jgi:transcription elongation factor GreA